VVAACYGAAARVWARAVALGRRREDGDAWGKRKKEREREREREERIKAFRLFYS
jgi:hypothetical protein